MYIVEFDVLVLKGQESSRLVISSLLKSGKNYVFLLLLSTLIGLKMGGNVLGSLNVLFIGCPPLIICAQVQIYKVLVKLDLYQEATKINEILTTKSERTPWLILIGQAKRVAHFHHGFTNGTNCLID